ncbi:MAG: hypothetical protein ACI9BW_003587 [Gammaproteobacteria bacterium]|jgi:hypothetical protein
MHYRHKHRLDVCGMSHRPGSDLGHRTRLKLIPRTSAKRIGAAITFALVVLSSHVAMANVRWYQVEVIVFRHTNTEAAGREQWPQSKLAPDFSDAQPLNSQATPPRDDELRSRPNEVSIAGPSAFQSLARSELTTSGIFRRLRSHGAYDPVLHVGWRQPARDARRTSKVLLSDRPRPATRWGEGSPDALDAVANEVSRVEGTLRLQSGRLLSVAVDFFNDDGASSGRITERRAIRFKELHYFDEPSFGVIVQVTPYRVGGVASKSESSN